MRQNVYDDPEFFAGYREMRDNAQGLNEAVVRPSLDRMLPDLSGKRVLDLGCGEGWFCRYAVAAGAASVVGVDPSSRMLGLARARASNEAITFVEGFLEDVDLPHASADVLVCLLVLHYVADLAPSLRRASDWLDSGGVFVGVVEHPMVTAQRPKTGWASEEGHHIAWPVNHYFDEGERTERWFVDGVVKYHRSISTILNAVGAAGLTIDVVDEPRPDEEVLGRYPQHRDELIRPSLLSWRAVK